MASGVRELLVPLIDRTVKEAAAAGVVMLTADDIVAGGRYVNVGGRTLHNFATCGYLDLAWRDELKAAAIEAIRRYGTQFSISRLQLQLPLYVRLEHALEAITGGHVVVAPTTTLAHQATLPVLVRRGDTVLLDRFAHTSLHVAAEMLNQGRVVRVEHDDFEAIEREIDKAKSRPGNVYYVFDGLYSMHGDLAPMRHVASLLEAYPKLHLYVDDAHSTSWTGRQGRGWALEQLPDRSRVIVALSLNKAFGAGGGAVVFPSAEDRDVVRRCGGPLTFSGPVQPAMLAAAIASAELHVRPEFASLQGRLLERITLVIDLAARRGVALANTDPTPIFFVPCGSRRRAGPVVKALAERGFLVSPGAFPTVPIDAEGVRFTVSLHNTPEDIVCLMDALAEVMSEAETAHAVAS